MNYVRNTLNSTVNYKKTCNIGKKESAVREAIAKGTINADDKDALIAEAVHFSNLADTVEVIDSDDEEALSQMKEARKENL